MFSQQESMSSDSGLMCIEENLVFDRIVSNTTALGLGRMGKGNRG